MATLAMPVLRVSSQITNSRSFKRNIAITSRAAPHKRTNIAVFVSQTPAAPANDTSSNRENISATAIATATPAADKPSFNLTTFLRAAFRPALACCLIAGLIALNPPAALAAKKAAAAAAATAAEPSGLVGIAKSALSFILHLDVHLGDIVARYGATTYAILFAIVFAETGLVVTPFLPGDSLLFATGALAALGKLSLPALLAVYFVAATLGDAVNYAIGNSFGAAALRSSLVKKEYIARTEKFYQEYGGKTIILARFVPIVRTFAPFVAGVGSMSYSKFGLYNVAGALLWTAVCTGAGFAFGNVPAVHENFSLVVLGIIAVSLVPVVFEVLAAKKESSSCSSSSNEAAKSGNVGRSGVAACVGGSMFASFN